MAVVFLSYREVKSKVKAFIKLSLECHDVAINLDHPRKKMHGSTKIYTRNEVFFYGT